MKLRILLPLSLAATGALWAAIDQEKKPVAGKADEPAIQSAVEPKPTAEQLDFFEKKIRPVLSERCYKCHSEKADKVKGSLVLDTREGARRGGDSGPAVVPGNLDDSILIQAVRYTNKDFAMPPEKSGGKLSDAIIRDFETWVKMGAPDPREGAAKLVKKFSKEDAKNWWSFQPPKEQTVPKPKNSAWAHGDVDRFLLAALEEKKLKPVGDADPATLLRRIYFDLTGLPPSPLDVGQFFADWKTAGANAAQQQAALGKWVDKLLASPQFGERWGRHWLDVARYAESSGKDVNIAFPHAWRYRDYVIAAFNQDKPYDQFLREQLAGDLLPSSGASEKTEHMVATGFLAIGPKGLNEQNPRQYCLDLADEQVDTVSQALLGLTISCARCHDHKFDPISQREYYGLAGIFLSTDTLIGTASGIQNRHATELVELPKGAATTGKTISPADLEKMKKRLDDLKKEQREMLASRFNAGKGPATPPAGNELQRFLIVATQVGALEAQVKGVDDKGQAKALAMGVKDLPEAQAGGLARFGEFMRRGPQARIGRPPEFAAVRDSALYARGEADKPTEKVPRSFPAVLSTDSSPTIPAKESGRRQLAEWITSPSNPLTSRVMVNRIWHTVFGRGIVESADNFGTTGKKPSNQALLDFLAVKFQTPVGKGGYGWSVKKFARDLVMSHAYQLSSDYDSGAFAADPENALQWRMSKRRLDAECIRDAMLSASQQLQLSPPTASAIGLAGDGPIGGPRFRPGGITEEQLINSGATAMVRSVYLPIARDVPPDALAVFDFSDASLVTGARDTTNVPAQALFLLNGDMAAAASRKLAERVMAAYPGGPTGGVSANLEQRLGLAYWITLGRSPTQNERTAAWNFFQKFPSNWSKGDKTTPGLKDAEDVRAAWTSFCRALFATSDFRYLN
ncbi:MAG: PSD1 and planctomycete cytochrome C domain-containing protein [Chthoniobacteraceae bacterium]